MTYAESVLCGLERLRTHPGTCCKDCNHRRDCEQHGCYIIREATSLIEALLMQREEMRNG